MTTLTTVTVRDYVTTNIFTSTKWRHIIESPTSTSSTRQNNINNEYVPRRGVQQGIGSDHDESVMSELALVDSSYASSASSPPSPPTKLTMWTLTAILGTMYGVAIVLALVWISWLWVKRHRGATMSATMIAPRHKSHRIGAYIT